MMYITKIKLDGVRCYEKAEIDFGDSGTSIVICGNNGSGKTTLLRSIALGLCDHISAGALLRDLAGDFIRKSIKEDRKAVIAIELSSESGKDTYTIATTFKTRRDIGFEWVETSTKKNGVRLKKEYQFPWQDIFVTAYGAGLRTIGSEDYVQYLAPDAVYSLFDYSYPLHNPELAWRRLVEVGDRKGIETLITNTLKDILSLNENDSEITIENNGIFIESSWGKQELDALGDGYRALVTLTLDILAWQLLAKNHELIIESYESKRNLKSQKHDWEAITDFKSLKGIVIIDEIEKHLHPRLQLRVLKSLRTNFPNMQFIVSTHSPLVISSAGDIPTVFIEQGHIGEKKHLDGWLAENIYLEMGTGGSRSEEYKKIIRDYEKLFIKQINSPLSGKELIEFNFLRNKLKNLPGTDLALFDIETKNLLEEMNQDEFE